MSLNSEEFLSLPIMFSDHESMEGGWTRSIKRKGTVAELLDIWDIDSDYEWSEMAQVLRHLRRAIRQSKGSDEQV